MQPEIDVSVIIPMYNSEKFIEKTIDSIVKQEAHGLNYEIIIVDDASSDHSGDVVKNLKNDKIRLIELESNAGTANARNKGICVAQGKWIQFVDSDDRICSDLYKKFETTQKHDKKQEINCYLFSLVGEYKEYTLKQTIMEVKDKRAFGHFGSVCNKFMKREICLPFKKEYSFEDNCFIIDMMNAWELKIGLIEDAFYLYNRKNDRSKMANFSTNEYLKMHNYVFSQLDKSDDFTKMYMLEIFVAVLFDRAMPFFMSLQIATKTLLRLFKFLPAVYVNQNRQYIKNTKVM